MNEPFIQCVILLHNQQVQPVRSLELFNTGELVVVDAVDGPYTGRIVSISEACHIDKINSLPWILSNFNAQKYRSQIYLQQTKVHE